MRKDDWAQCALDLLKKTEMIGHQQCRQIHMKGNLCLWIKRYTRAASPAMPGVGRTRYTATRFLI